MTESTSRIIAGLEAALLCLPLTALFLYGGLSIPFYSLIRWPNVENSLFALACVVVTAALICAWRLLLAFIFGGRTKLQTASTKWWAIPYATACLSLIAPLFVAITEIPSVIGIFGWGLPLILPLAHLHFERKTLRVK